MELIITSMVAFASTNIDDIFILMLFFGSKRYKQRDIVIGQFLGVGALIAISVIGSFAGLLIHKQYIGLLGLLPIFLGIRALLTYFKKRKETEIAHQTDIVKKGVSVFAVAAVTFANGGDNIGVYVPLFSTQTISGKLVMISIFLIMIALWCIIGKYLSSHLALAKAIDKYGHIVTPIILILLGLYILYENESLTYFFLLAFRF